MCRAVEHSPNRYIYKTLPHLRIKEHCKRGDRWQVISLDDYNVKSIVGNRHAVYYMNLFKFIEKYLCLSIYSNLENISYTLEKNMSPDLESEKGYGRTQVPSSPPLLHFLQDLSSWYDAMHVQHRTSPSLSPILKCPYRYM